MKTKLFALALSLFAGWTLGASAQVQVNFSIYSRIPVAPNMTLNVGTYYNHAPSPEYVWIEGYWTWDFRAGAYVWVSGYWACPPYQGAYWIPGYWERVPNGYFWVNASWMPRNHRMAYGHYDGRYDYYGRPVYYHKPQHVHQTYAYAYDHRPDYRRVGYSSSAYYNSSRDNSKKQNQQIPSRTSSRVENNDKSKQGKGNGMEMQQQNNRTSTHQFATQPSPSVERSSTRMTGSQTQPSGQMRSSANNQREEMRSSSGQVNTRSQEVRNGDNSSDRGSRRNNNSTRSTSTSSRFVSSM